MALHSSKHTGVLLTVGLIAVGALIAGVMYLGSAQKASADKDPLTALLGDSLPSKNNLKGDLAATSIAKYDGPRDATVDSCVSSDTRTNFVPQVVKAPWKTGAVLTQTLAQIQAEITPVFGYASGKGQLAWKYDKKTNTYVFSTYPGDEKFWKCYLTTGPIFFQTIFDSTKVDLDVKQLATPTNLTAKLTNGKQVKDPLSAVLGKAEVKLTWKNPKNSPADSYMIAYGTDKTNLGTQVPVATATTFTLKDLSFNTKYYFVVWAIRGDKTWSDSAKSDPVELTTTPTTTKTSGNSSSSNDPLTKILTPQ